MSTTILICGRHGGTPGKCCRRPPRVETRVIPEPQARPDWLKYMSFRYPPFR